ncbi:MBOAT family protein [Polaribacter vadi]|nr:MBOAT family protein [Polaribacter vadi]
MIFNSIEFLIFFLIIFITYWCLNKKPLVFQNILLLVASYFFYGWWDWRFLGLIAFSTIIDFYIGKILSKTKQSKKRKILLFSSLAINLGFLGFFKYFNFFINSFEELLQNLGINFDTWTLKIILPVGISFYTFQTMSYTIDVYKEKIKHTDNFISFAVFVSFFPQLVAGPIERASNLLPQFQKKRKFNLKQSINGCSLIVYGFFKKIVIADRLAIYVNSVFNNVETANTISLIIAAVFFAFQIYADFSGYSLIARGISKLIGFELMINFNKPYLATNISDFWRRWHISLSTWFKDYLYIPLGGNRVSKKRNYYNLMIVFVTSGLWHGANWTFVIWGFLHGLFQIIYLNFIRKSRTKSSENKFRNFIKVVFVFTIVTLAWIFFRAENLNHAIVYFEKLIQFDLSFNLNQITAQKGPLNLLLSFLAIILLYLTYLFPKDLKFKKEGQNITFIIIFILLIFIIGVNGKEEFIYFQF